MRTVRSVMTRDPLTLPASATVREALEILEGGAIRHLPVVEGGRVVGILSDLDLRAWRQALLDHREGEATGPAAALLDTPITQRMTTAVTCVEADAPLRDAVEGLLERKVGALPVLEQGRLVGIVSVVDVLGAVRDQLDGTPAGEGEEEATSALGGVVADRMTPDPVVASPHELLSGALQAMIDHDVRHLPVVDDEGLVVGVISHRDLLGQGAWRTGVNDPGTIISLGRALTDRTVEEVMATPDLVDPETPLAEAARLMLEGGYGCLPVVNHRGELVGILSESDFVRASAEAA